MKVQISFNPKFEDVNSMDYINALVLEGDTSLIMNLSGSKAAINEQIQNVLAEHGLYDYQYDYKEKYNCDGEKCKVRYYYQDLPVLIVITTFK